MSIAERIVSLSPEKRALLQQRLATRRTPVANTAITLSAAQRRTWTLHQLDPSGRAYNVPFVLRLDGPLDRSALARSLALIAQRHDGLRLAVTEHDGEPVARHLDQDLTLQPITLPPDATAEAAVTAFVERPFDPATGLARAGLLDLGNQTHVLALVFHHMVFDGRSIAVLLRELDQFYRTFHRGETPSPPPLPWRYADFAAWEAGMLRQDGLATARAVWRNRLEGPPGAVSFAAASAGIQTNPREAPACTLSATIGTGTASYQSLKQFAAAEGTTPFAVLLTTLAALLAHWSRTTDLVIGIESAAGVPPRFEGVIGLFLNPLPIRVEFTARPSLRQQTRQVRERLSEALAHSQYPFERLVADFRQSGQRQPLFNVALSMREQGMESFSLDDLTATPHPGGGSAHLAPKFDLALSLIDTGHIIGGAIEADSRLWTQAALDSFTHALEALLAAAVAAPDRPLAELPLAGALPPSKGVPAPTAITDFAALFEAAADQAQDAPALWFGGSETSYRSLEARANRLARVLLATGANRTRPVALFIDRDRGPDLVACVLAVLKTGAAFTVLDRRQASERHRAILQDAEPSIVIAAGGAPPDGPWQTIDLDTLERDSATLPTARPARSVSPDDAAYIVFTSGSTGRPKGVVATQSGLANLCAAQRACFGLNQTDRVVQFSAVTFDAFAWDLALAWGAAASLVLGTVDELAPGDDLAALLVRSRTTTLTIPPTALAALPSAELPDLRLLIVCGEPCPAALTERWGPGRRMVNAYGPTEATIWASYDEVSAGASPPIGRAIPGASLHLLDEALMPVPVGAVGEICIGGAGVTRGYLNAPDLTAAAFIPDPSAVRPGARLYRTGDLGCWLPDGRVHYLGRCDDQVKIRGFRIEPAEVARTLERLPAVARAHVAVVERPTGDTALAAWIEPSGNPNLDLGALRRAVEALLPHYMRPAAYVVVPQFSAGAHGKIDTRRLPAPSWDAAAQTQATPPQGPIETALAKIWCAVLGRSQVGRQDDFFALGGDSIQAVRVIARMRQDGWVLKLSDLFSAPVLRDLASRAAQAVPETPQDLDRQTWKLTPSQAGILFHHLRAPSMALYVQRFDLTLTGPLDPTIFAAAWKWLVARHEALRAHVQWRNGEPLLTFQTAGPPDVIEADWRTLDPAAQDEAAESILAPPDPERPPLMRLALARCGDQSWRFIWAVHHLIADGWSLSVLIDEWHAVYRALQRDEPPALPPAAPYRSYLAWLEARDQAAALAFWRQQLGGIETPARLATAGEANGSGWATDSLELDTAATERLLSLSTGRGITLNTAVQAAWARVLQVWTGQSDVVSGMVIAGRPADIAGIERMVGLFVNTVPCRLTVPSTGLLAQWLATVRAALAMMQEHGHVPLAALQRLMGFAPDVPPFDALVAVQTFPAETSESGDIEITARPSPARTDYPLTLLIEPGPRLRIQIVTDRRFLSPATGSALGRAFATALTNMPDQIEQPIGAWQVIDPAEHARVLSQSTGLVHPVAADRMLPDLIAAAAARHPTHPALISDSATWTHAELLEQADRVACWLSRKSIGPERIVALLADRSPELIAATLGIWRAGAAFLPLGPDQPAERLRAMTARARPDLLIAHRHHTAKASELGIETAWLDDQPWSASPALAPTAPIAPESAAYVIFTSGSTGEPKGVVTSHAGILNRLLWGQRHRPIGPGDRIVQKTPYTFDVSVWEMIWPLLTGATLVIARPGGHLDMDYLAGLAARESATVMHFVPSMLRMFLEDPKHGRSLASVRRIICSGEALPGDLRDKLHALTGAELLNFYGPTEASIEVGQHAATSDDQDAAVPLGRPIDNTRLYVVDRDFNLCPSGFPGELLIGGIAVGRGYIGRPDLTAERFIPDPFAARPGARVYRTGDLARWRADGVIEFLGRVDWQVKIRGQRVEPEEIAAALKTLPGIREAVVLYRQEPNGDGRLAAYLVGEPQPPADLRRAASVLLPDAMIPSSFQFLPNLPVGPSGKLDRAALPAPMAATAPRQGRPPSDALEWRLAAEWRAVLGGPEISPDDHFLADLGGHSLDALRLIGRLTRQWPGALGLSDFLRDPTVTGVANLLRARTAPTRGIVPLVPDGDGTPIILVHPAVGTVLCFVGLSKVLGALNPAVRGPVWGLEAPGFDGRAAPIDSVVTLARYHIEDILPRLEGRLPILAGYSFGGLVAFEIATQLAESGNTPAHLLILDTPAPSGSDGPVPDDLTMTIDIVHLLERYDGRPPGDYTARLAAIPQPARALAARNFLLEAGVLGGAIEAVDLAAVVTVARAALIARSTFQPRVYAGAVTVLRAATPAPADTLGVDPELLADPAFGWRDLVSGTLTTAKAPGDHVSLLLPPGVDTVARMLADLTSRPSATHPIAASGEAVGFPRGFINGNYPAITTPAQEG